MFFSVRVSLERDGKYKAICSELGFTARDADRTTAIEKVEFLIAEWLVASKEITDDLYVDEFCENRCLKGIFSMLKINDDRKLLFIPRQVRKF